MQSQVPTTLQVIKKTKPWKKKTSFECTYFKQIGILSTCSRGKNYQVNVRRRLGNEYPPIIVRLMALCNRCFKVDRWNARVCVLIATWGNGNFLAGIFCMLTLLGSATPEHGQYPCPLAKGLLVAYVSGEPLVSWRSSALRLGWDVSRTTSDVWESGYRVARKFCGF